MTYDTYAAGFDYGNADSCLVMYHKSRKLSRSIPSATAQGRLSELHGLGINLGKNDYVFADVSGNAGELYVGELALTQSNLSSTGRGDTSRYARSNARFLLLTLAASLVDEREFGLTVVAGIPVETYKNDTHGEFRTQVKNVLQGDHTFLFNGRECTIHVTVERIIMEGAGALMINGIKKPGIQGVIDIGGKTTDLFAANIQTPLRQFCKGKPLGVELAADNLSDTFQILYGRPLKSSERRDILHAYASQGERVYPALYYHGTEIHDLRGLTREAMHTMGSQITSFISAAWNEFEVAGEVAGSFAQVLLVGGGAYYFEEQIRSIIPNVKVVMPHPEEANAAGYAAMAERQMQQRLNIHIA